MAQIINQPEFRGYSVNLVFTCACMNKNTLMVSGRVGMKFGCNFCKRTWQVMGMSINPQTHELQAVLAEIQIVQKELIHG